MPPGVKISLCFSASVSKKAKDAGKETWQYTRNLKGFFESNTHMAGTSFSDFYNDDKNVYPAEQARIELEAGLSGKLRESAPGGSIRTEQSSCDEACGQALPENNEPLYLLVLEAERDAALSAEMREWREGLIADGIRSQEETGGDSDASRYNMRDLSSEDVALLK